MHRDKTFWGADADLFRPGRWNTNIRPKSEYIPFGGGIRACPGMKFTYLGVAFMLVMMVREFEMVKNMDEVGE